MYGVVNKAIEDLVKANFGEEKWNAAKKRSGVKDDYFISSEPYDDAITYQLAGAISEEMNMPVEEVMIAFGEWWVLKTGKEKYGGLMEAGGNSLREFLVNLPLFHNRVMLIYPKLTPPEFKISDVESNSVNVHYFSKREGLKDFVKGLLQGLGKMYNTPVEIVLIKSRDAGDTHEVFNVSWK
ncbi:MAG TPA: heme NO-binding domain-containing protein [Panacibacter sp.]|nr:heme NO-binding domain-containing protein [Panacibacter sp.]